MLSSDFLFPRFFVVPLANPSNFSHCKCFSSRIPFLFQHSLCIMTCISGTSRGSTRREDRTIIRYLLEYLWTNNYSIMSNNLLLDNYVEFANQY